MINNAVPHLLQSEFRGTGENECLNVSCVLCVRSALDGQNFLYAQCTHAHSKFFPAHMCL